MNNDTEARLTDERRLVVPLSPTTLKSPGLAACQWQSAVLPQPAHLSTTLLPPNSKAVIADAMGVVVLPNEELL